MILFFKKVLRIIPGITLFLLPLITFAAGYRPIVGIPGVSDGNFNEYINAIYALAISLAALLAVIKIIIAGVKWMMTDIVTSKMDAKKDIQGALLGLLVILAAVLVLTVINPDIIDNEDGVGLGNSGFPTLDTGVAPPDPVVASTVTPTVEDGYTWILCTDPYLAKESYSESCVAEGNSLTYDCGGGGTNQISCISPTASQQSAIGSLLPSETTVVEKESFADLYVAYVNPELSPEVLADAAMALQVTRGAEVQQYFGVLNSNNAGSLTREQISGFTRTCQQYAQLEGDTSIGVFDSNIGATEYLICAKIN